MTFDPVRVVRLGQMWAVSLLNSLEQRAYWVSWGLSITVKTGMRSSPSSERALGGPGEASNAYGVQLPFLERSPRSWMRASLNDHKTQNIPFGGGHVLLMRRGREK